MKGDLVSPLGRSPNFVTLSPGSGFFVNIRGTSPSDTTTRRRAIAGARLATKQIKTSRPQRLSRRQTRASPSAHSLSNNIASPPACHGASLCCGNGRPSCRLSLWSAKGFVAFL